MTLQDLAIKAISEVKKNIKKLIDDSKKGKSYDKLPENSTLNIKTLKEATRLKSEMEILQSKIAVLHDQYQPLRDEILASLPGGDIDKVEVLIDGIQIKKSVQIRGAGTLDQKKLGEIARNKRIYQKITKRVTVIDEDKVMAALADGSLTYEEYMSCLSEGKPVPTLKLEPKFQPEVESNNEVDQEVI